jgi:hypothetical protein
MEQSQSYYIDEKVTIWRRTYYSIDGTEEETKSTLIESVEGRSGGELLNGFVDSEILYETEELITPEENGGQPTMEVFNSKGETIWSNGKNS